MTQNERDEGRGILFGLFNKDDFRIAGGFQLKLGPVKIPVLIEIFFNPEKDHKLDWEYHPNE